MQENLLLYGQLSLCMCWYTLCMTVCVFCCVLYGRWFVMSRKCVSPIMAVQDYSLLIYQHVSCSHGKSSNISHNMKIVLNLTKLFWIMTGFRYNNDNCCVLKTPIKLWQNNHLLVISTCTFICTGFFVLCAVVCLLILLCVHLTDLAFWLFSFCAFSWIPWKQNLVSAVWSPFPHPLINQLCCVEDHQISPVM